MYGTATTPYGLSGNGEYFMNVEDIDVSPKEIKAYIPKLMPQIKMGNKADNNRKVTVNTSIFINAPDCAVVGVEPVLTAQNYLTIPHYKNQQPNFKAKAVLVDKDKEIYKVKKHTKFMLEILHDDIGNMYFTEKV